MKNSIRQGILAERDALSEKERKELSDKIFQNLITRPGFLKAGIVAAYIAKGSEVDTKRIIEYCLDNGKTVLVPCTNDKIEMVKFLGFEKLAPARFGVLEPTEKIAGQNPDVVLIPGVAFGLCMHRIGYGKGYYDRYLKSVDAYRVGLCYDFQVLEKLPAHEWDEKMNEIITEKRVIRARTE